MKPTSSVVAIISLACLFIFFRSCHGIICYSCSSMNYGDKLCENVEGDEYAFDYGTYADNCMRMLLYKINHNNETVDRLLNRCGFKKSERKDLLKEVEKHKSHGYTVEFRSCKTDKCNYD